MSTASQSIRTFTDLTPDERTLLLKLHELTPPKYRRQERDDRHAEDVGQEAGMSTVGVPTGARVPMAFKVLAEAGFVERVKGDGSGPIRYRVSQLGEREIMASQVEEFRKELDRTFAQWHNDHARQTAMIAKTKADLLAAQERIAELERPWWRKALNRPPKEGQP